MTNEPWIQIYQEEAKLWSWGIPADSAILNRTFNVLCRVGLLETAYLTNYNIWGRYFKSISTENAPHERTDKNGMGNDIIIFAIYNNYVYGGKHSR